MKQSKIFKLEQELNLAEKEINAAARAFNDGEILELNIFEQRVERICVQLFEISPKDARRLGSRLPYLAQLLDEIAQKIKCKRSETISDSRTHHKKAVKAYAKHPSLRNSNY